MSPRDTRGLFSVFIGIVKRDLEFILRYVLSRKLDKTLSTNGLLFPVRPEWPA
jgi:hypothetical protein